MRHLSPALSPNSVGGEGGETSASVRADEARAAGDGKIHGRTLTISGQGVECAGKTKASSEAKAATPRLIYSRLTRPAYLPRLAA
jgi:hypothetical protein